MTPSAGSQVQAKTLKWIEKERNDDDTTTRRHGAHANGSDSGATRAR